MSRYIKADDLKKEMDELEGWFKDLKWKIENLEEDVEPVVHGEWKGKPIAGYCTVRCSVCGSAFLDNDGRWNYCPNCGADMRGGENE